MQDFQAFTIKYSGRVNVLKSDIEVSIAFDPKIVPPQQRPILFNCMAIWDTGASCSVISKSLATKIGLIPTGKTQITGVNNSTLENTYYVNIYLPHKVAFMFVRIAEVPGITDAELLIGMDIIGMGDFSIFTASGKTVMTFRTPSLGSEDFVATANKINQERELKDKRNQEAQARKKLSDKEKKKIKKKMQEKSKDKNRKN